MGSDSRDLSRRKHSRSSSDESEESSKRRKHRHNRHRHHYRHGGNKRKGEEASYEEDIKIEDGDVHEGADAVVPPQLGGVVTGSFMLPNYDDMEEGEIIEDDSFDMTDGELVKKGDEARGDLENLDMGVFAVGEGLKPSSGLPLEKNEVKLDKQFLKSVEDKGGVLVVDKSTLDRKDNMVEYSRDEFNLKTYSNHANGSVGWETLKEGDKYERSQRKVSSSVEGTDKPKRYYEEDETYLRDQERTLTPESKSRRHKSSHSSSHDRHHEGLSITRNRSRSHERVGERSHSRSILEASHLQEKQHYDDAYYANRKHKSESDGERMTVENEGYHHNSRGLLRGKERERSSSCSKRTERVGRDNSQEGRSRGRDGYNDSWDMDPEVRGSDKDRKRQKEHGTEWEKARERSRDKDRDRERIREKDRDREREMERERQRGRDRDRGSRHHDYDDGYVGQNRYKDSRSLRRDEKEHRDRPRKSDSEKNCPSKNVTSNGEDEKHRRDEDEQDEYQERIALQLAEQEDDELVRIKEESRRRRQAILEKYKTQPLQRQDKTLLENTVKKNMEQLSDPSPAINVVSKNPNAKIESSGNYGETSFSVGKSPQQNGTTEFETTTGIGRLGEGTPKSEISGDMFCDDIFGESPAGIRKSEKGDGLAIERSALHDNWDDADGYYSYRFGEILDGRFEVIAAHGKGVFSTVVRAKDLKAGPRDPEEVAIKIIRNNETMYKAGVLELGILKKLVGADPEDRRHCVRFISSFKYRNHLCLVFESLHMNLREVLKKFGRNIGLKLTAIRAYAKQLFISLKHLRNCGVLHCDIKPDNMLVNEAKNVLKLCDFGNAMFAGKNEITPYLVSRFYRAPEIILGLPYDHPLDIWSVGCCLFELYTGKVLFPGPTNNDMLRLHMELKGPFPKKMVRKAAFADQHFDQDLNFLATEEDPVTKKSIRRLILNVKPKDMGTIFLSSLGEDPKMLSNFKDMLEKIFVLDPDKRLSVAQALSHPFITGK